MVDDWHLLAGVHRMRFATVSLGRRLLLHDRWTSTGLMALAGGAGHNPTGAQPIGEMRRSVGSLIVCKRRARHSSMPFPLSSKHLTHRPNGTIREAGIDVKIGFADWCIPDDLESPTVGPFDYFGAPTLSWAEFNRSRCLMQTLFAKRRRVASLKIFVGELGNRHHCG